MVPPRCRMPGRASRSRRTVVVLEQPPPPVPEAEELEAVLARPPDDGADDRVQAGAVAAAREDRDFHVDLTSPVSRLERGSPAPARAPRGLPWRARGGPDGLWMARQADGAREVSPVTTTSSCPSPTERIRALRVGDEVLVRAGLSPPATRRTGGSRRASSRGCAPRSRGASCTTAGRWSRRTRHAGVAVRRRRAPRTSFAGRAVSGGGDRALRRARASSARAAWARRRSRRCASTARRTCTGRAASR